MSYNLNIYPNPSKGIYTVELDMPSEEEISISIYDLAGKEIYMNDDLNSEGMLETQIDLSGYADGMYQLQIRTEKLLIHRMLIKN